MNKIFKYFLPWLALRIVTGSVNLTRSFRTCMRNDPGVAMFISFLLICISGLISILSAVAYGSIVGLTDKEISQLIPIVLRWATFTPSIYILISVAIATYEAFLDDQNDLLNKLKE